MILFDTGYLFVGAPLLAQKDSREYQEYGRTQNAFFMGEGHQAYFVPFLGLDVLSVLHAPGISHIQ